MTGKHHCLGAHMSTILLQPQKLRTGALLLCLLLVGLFSGGCGTHHVSLSDPAGRAAWETPAYVDRDDGLPLSPAELAAFNNTGELDRGLSDAALRDVAVQYKYFLHKGRTTMERFAQRSQEFLPYARKVFRAKGLPEELAYLAIVESGYNARAVSPAGAAGAWQFMPYTGMKYGLNQDWWMDERLDPYKATEAAADYLAKLYGDFHDWHLAVAAYNAGEGKIGRALEGTKTKNFFALKEKNGMLDGKAQLKEETKQYVPRFLAICKIMRNLQALGFSPVDLNRQPSMVRVHLRPGTDLMALAGAVGQSWEMFSINNTAHKRFVSHTDRSTYAYVPAQQHSAAMLHISSGRSGNGWKTYTAGRQDNWQTLSRKTGIPVPVLQSANRGANLRAGSSVRLPVGPGFKMPSPTSGKQYAEAQAKPGADKRNRANSSASAATARDKTAQYVLRPGDTLHAVAKEHNTSVAVLLSLNDVDDPRQLRAGQALRVPAAGPATASVAPARNAERASSGSLGRGSAKKQGGKPTTYTVQAGDTLWAIAKKYNISTSQLLAMNKANAKGTLRPGDKLMVSEQ